MADPQAENGHTDIANEIIEALARINLSAYESRILWAIFRQTYGWHKKADRISITRFQKITGIKRRNIVRTLNELIKREIIIRIDNTFITTYGFQKDYCKWKTVIKRDTNKTVIQRDNTPLSKGITESLSESPPIKETNETILKKEKPPLSPSLSNGEREGDQKEDGEVIMVKGRMEFIQHSDGLIEIRKMEGMN